MYNNKYNMLFETVVITQRQLKILCWLLQESSRTSRTSLFRTRRLWLALPNCATALRLLPGHSLCQASMTIRQANIESGGYDSQVAERWLGRSVDGERKNVMVVSCGLCLWIKMTLEFLFFFSPIRSGKPHFLYIIAVINQSILLKKQTWLSCWGKEKNFDRFYRHEEPIFFCMYEDLS